MNQKIPTWRSRKFLNWVKEQPCCNCWGASDDPHHIKIKGVGGKGLTAPDFAVMSLCRACHGNVHAAGPDYYPQTRWMIETLNRAFADGILEVK